MSDLNPYFIAEIAEFKDKEDPEDTEDPEEEEAPHLTRFCPHDPQVIRRSRQERRLVTLNVGGERHEVAWRMLERVPQSRQGAICFLSNIFFSIFFHFFATVSNSFCI